MAAGGALVAGGVVTGGLALNDASKLVADCPNNVCNGTVALDSRRSTIHTLGITTDVLLFVGGAAAITGLILGLVLNSGSDSQDQPQIDAMCGPTGCSASVRARF